MNETIHIVCLDAPAPPDYGGAIDMFYKIEALHEIGKKIRLHYFRYNQMRNADEVKRFCSAVYSYPRKSFWQSRPLSHPFIVQSRINQELINRLNEDHQPVLLEGLHCSGIVPFLRNRERVVIRMHNEEAAYYQHLAKTERSVWKRNFFFAESRLLKQHQQTMDKTIQLACLSESDMLVFENDFAFQRVSFIPCFVPWQQPKGAAGKGDFCLYHGNLSVSENEEAALWLIENVFCKLTVPLVIAGKGISGRLLKSGKKYTTISFINNPSIAEIDQLVQKAHIHVLPSMNNTGVKLKLLNALFNGRHCITNANGIKGSSIQRGVIVQDNASGWISSIETLMQKEFSDADLVDRKTVLQLYNNRENAAKLSALWTHYQ